MKIGVTGASGFIGTNLIHYLESKGHHVNALVRDPGKLSVDALQKVRVFTGDISETSSLKTAFSECDAVIHLAALFNNPESTWEDYRKVNVQGVRNVIEAAKEAGVKKVIHCSTVGVAIGGEPMPYTEKSPYCYPKWDKYESTKYEGEILALEYSQKQNYPEIVVIRPGQVYGVGDKSKAKFYRMVKKRILINPGKTLKHLVYIDDLSQAFLLASEKEGLNGEIFTIAGDQIIPLKDLIKVVAKALNVENPKLYLPSTPIVILATIVEKVFNAIGKKPPIFQRSMDFFRKTVSFSSDKAKKVLGFEPKVSVQEGVQRTAEWYQKEGLI